MNSASRLVLLFVVLMSTTSWAQWQAPERQQVHDFNAAFHCRFCPISPFDDPYWVTVMDNIKLQTAALDRENSIFPGMLEEDLDLDRRAFVEPSGQVIPYRVSYWLNPDRPRAPLVVYLPGSFQGIDDPSSYEAARLLLASGNHVLIIPNPLSGEYIAKMPVDKLADFAAEGEVVLSVLRAFLPRHQNQITSVELSGASYGAFLASVVLAKDAASFAPMVDGQTTLLFSPLNMNRSVTALDDLITLSRMVPFPNTPEQLIGYGFQMGLTRLAKRVQQRFFEDEAHGFVARQYPDHVAHNFRTTDFDDEQVIASVRYRTLLTKFIGTDFESFQQPEFKLETWLTEAQARGNDRVRLLTTADDFLNDRGASLGLQSWIVRGGRLLIRATGGHAGMVADPWFASFILTSMRKDDAAPTLAPRVFLAEHKSDLEE